MRSAIILQQYSDLGRLLCCGSCNIITAVGVQVTSSISCTGAPDLLADSVPPVPVGFGVSAAEDSLAEYIAVGRGDVYTWRMRVPAGTLYYVRGVRSHGDMASLDVYAYLRVR